MKHCKTSDEGAMEAAEGTMEVVEGTQSQVSKEGDMNTEGALSHSTPSDKGATEAKRESSLAISEMGG